MNTTRLRRTSALKAVLVAAALILSAGAASAQTSPSGTLDANTLPPECGPQSSSCSGAGVNSENETAQTFTAINSGNVTSVQVQVEDWGGGTGDLVVQLATVDSSGAIGAIIPGASATVPESEIPPGPGEARLVTVSFNNPPAVQAGTKYALVLSSPNSTCEYCEPYVWIHDNPETRTDDYPQGEVFRNRSGGGWEHLSFDDTVFAIYVAQSTYDFAGFFSPVDNPPDINEVKAGRAIPVKFSLGGDQGLDIFESGYPKSVPMACESTGSVDAIEQTLSDNSSHLTYDATTDTYTYVWKTDKGWADTCRQLVLKLNDGSTEHVANFEFVK